MTACALLLSLCITFSWHTWSEESIKDGFKKIGHEFKKLGQEIGHAGEEVGHEAKKVGQAVAKESKTAAHDAKEAGQDVGHGFASALREFGAGIKKAWRRLWD